jgi:hypothetical protein
VGRKKAAEESGEEMRLDVEVTPRDLASMLYRLYFPRREFDALPGSVQRAYIFDANRLLTMLDSRYVTPLVSGVIDLFFNPS